jgi:hypothetical protein
VRRRLHAEQPHRRALRARDFADGFEDGLTPWGAIERHEDDAAQRGLGERRVRRTGRSPGPYSQSGRERAQQIDRGEDADQPLAFGHGQAADPVLEHQSHSFGERLVRRHRDHRARHHGAYGKLLEQIVRLADAQARRWRGLHRPHVTVRDDADQPTVLHDGQMADPPVDHELLDPGNGCRWRDGDGHWRHPLADPHVATS